jgi:hypothetical protein
MTSNEGAVVQAALARNDRYLFEFVEALSLCPWARRCRELGRLERRVLLQSGDPISAVVDSALLHVREFAERPASEVEVGLLIFPNLIPRLRDGLDGARAFEQLCGAVREAMQTEFANREVPFYCVAFHPDLGIDLSDENRAVRFIRRSPDPTLQLVRVSVLRDARGSQPEPIRFVDASKLSHAELMAIEQPMTLSEKIAKANWDALKREGPEKLRALLDGIARQ